MKNILWIALFSAVVLTACNNKSETTADKTYSIKAIQDELRTKGINSPLWQEAYKDCESDLDKGVFALDSKACMATSSIDELRDDKTLMKQYEEFKKQITKH